jgi:hypothetical protein
MRAKSTWLPLLLGTWGLVCAAGGGVAEAQRDDLVDRFNQPPPARFDSAILGAIADGGIGTSIAGDTLMFEAGGQFAGLATLRGGTLLVQWDAVLAARGGYLANQHPYLFLIGGRERAWAEVGYRFSPRRRWSPYAGARLGNELLIMAHPGLALSDVDTINNVDRVGGTVASGVVRADFGASFLAGGRSLLLVAFLEEELHAAEANTPTQAFTGGGVGARFDLEGRVTASIEGIWGVAPLRRDSLLGLTDRTTRVGTSAAFRKVFRNGMWGGASFFFERDSDHLVYAGGASYDTRNPPRFGVAILYGFPLGSARP